jgi:hypothetical protein
MLSYCCHLFFPAPKRSKSKFAKDEVALSPRLIPGAKITKVTDVFA